MNIAFVTRRFDTRGGTEKYSVDLGKWLVERGHDVHVYCASADARFAVHPGLHVVDLGPRTRSPGALARAAAQSVQLDAHDVVMGFVRTTTHHVFRAGGGAHLAWLRVRYPGWRRFWPRLRPGLRRELALDRQAVAAARRVVCNSNLAAGQIVEAYDVSPDRVVVIRNGVDLDRFRPDAALREEARARWGAPESGRVALFFGNGFRRKGLDTAARAFADAALGADRFVILGGDAHAPRWVARTRALLGDRLVMHGPDPAPERFVPGADAVVLPTRFDSAANTTLEALACGVPVVTSGMDGNAEIVPSPTLVVADPTDVGGFATGLTDAWSGGVSLRAACRAAAEAWPVSRNGEAVEELFMELCDDDRC